MTLSDDRQKFSTDLARLVLWANAQPGWKVLLAEVARTPEQAALYAQEGKGVAKSAHLNALAADLLLYIYGAYQTETVAYAPLGVQWETLDEANVWGGRFTSPRPDGDHFERRILDA